MLRAFAAHIESVREAERARIAREIHDQLGQALTGLRMDLPWLRKRLPADLAAPAGKIRSMLRLINDTTRSVRRIVAGLRPLALDDADLQGAIRWETRGFQARTGVRCRLEPPAERLDFDPDRATAIFRIFQEAMTNSRSKAWAAGVRASGCRRRCSCRARAGLCENSA
ncbi:MAG TPA: histidine kinase [Burkholderiales bacterium]